MTEPTEKNEKSAENNEKSEKLPISDFYKVVDSVTIFENSKWWEAIVIYESSGRRSMGLCLWQKKNDTWKRKNKFGIRNIDEWNKLKNAADQLAPKFSAE